MHRRLLAALLVAAAVSAVFAQSPAFEVASIKRNVSVGQLSSINAQPGGRITVTNDSLHSIVRNINRLQSYQIVGGPDWADKDRWDIVAKGAGDPAFEQMVTMMQTLLADRFKLKTHRETREMPIYALMRPRADGRLGPQIKPSTTDCEAIAAAARAQGGTAARPPGAGPQCGVNMNGSVLRMNARPLADLARNISIATDRMVVDKTGLPGIFDLELRWNETDGPSLVTAVQEQLGLKLEPQRGPVDVLVIDSAERPTED